MNRHSSNSVGLVVFSLGSHSRAAYKPHANGALQEKRIWTNDDSERLSDHRLISFVGQITEEVTDAAVVPPPHMTPAIRAISAFQCHLLNPEHEEMMEKVLFQ
jgi:hypothetical protein